MSQYKEAEIADTVYFWFAANTTAGAAGDGATPLYDVRLAGAAAGAAPTASGTPTLLTHADYTDGLHEIAIDTTGWSAGEYAVFCTLTISTVNPAGFCGSFKLLAAGASTRSKATQAVVDTTVIKARVPDIIKNTALTKWGLPMFLTTGVAAGAGLAVTVAIRKDGAAWGAPTNAADATDAKGWSSIDWAAADLNANMIDYEATAAGCLPTRGSIITKA